MSEQLTNHDVDERGRSAGVAVMRAAASRPIPAFDDTIRTEHEPVVGRRRGRVLLAAAAAMMVVAGAGMIWASPWNDGIDQAPSSPEPEQPLVPNIVADLPVGWEPLGAFDTKGDAPPTVVAALDVFGPTATEPLFGVAFIPEGRVGEPGGTLDFRRRVDVGGKIGYIERTARGGPASLSIGTDGGVLLVLARGGAGGLDDERIVALGAQLTVDGIRVVVPDRALSDATRFLGTEANMLSIAYPILLDDKAAEVSRVAAYRFEGGEDVGFLQVTTSRGDVARQYSSSILGLRNREATIDGQIALVSSIGMLYQVPAVDATLVSWMDDSGQLIRVFAYGVDENVVLDSARRVRSATDGEWDSLLHLAADADAKGSSAGGTLDASLPPMGTAPAETESAPVLGEGTFADGTAWTLVTYDEGSSPQTVSLMVDLPTANSSSGSGSERSSSIFRSDETQRIGGRTFSAGVVARKVRAVDIQDEDGGRSSAAMVRSNGITAWVAEIDAPPTSTFTVIAIDAAGVEIGQTEIESP